ncbi:exodeoxyribonuclease III [Breznakiellaceae bacterium SP9]
MRIISWNVNGIRAVHGKGFLQWLALQSPDIICLQETKAQPQQLPPHLCAPVDADGNPYCGYWASAKRKGYSGVVIFSKSTPRNSGVMGIDAFDAEGRLHWADYGDFILICAYFPNSQDGGKRLPYKIAFCDAALDFCNGFVHAGRHIVLCGDYNIAHKPIDLARPKENEDSPGFFPQERAWMDRFTQAGYVDTFRHFYPDKTEAYTWWSYRTAARERNVGWRIDYHCVDAGLLPWVQKAEIMPFVTGSDHCPVELVLESPLRVTNADQG